MFSARGVMFGFMERRVDDAIWSPERDYYARRTQVGARRRGLGEIILLVFGAVVAAALAEGAIRLFHPRTLVKEGYSPVRGHRSQEPKNHLGYRDVEHTPVKPAGVFRAVFVGDSFTFGAGILLDDTYAKREERALSAARSQSWESIVLAVPGIDTEDEASIIEGEALGYNPDIVVVGYVLNDAEPKDAAEGRRAISWRQNQENRRNPPWWRHSALLSLIGDRIHATVENRNRIANHLDIYRPGSPGLEMVRKSLSRIAAACREKGVPLLVAIFPLFANPLDDRYPFTEVHEKVASLCRSSGIMVVDLLPYYRDLDWRLLVVEGAQDEHPNELAHRIAAQALLPTMQTALGAPLGAPTPPPG